jgi:hypothetical protein
LAIWGSLSGIFRSDKDNTEEIQLPSEHTTDVTRSVLGVEGEWLFYTVSIRPPHKDFESYVSKFGQHKQLHAVKVDGSKHVVINPDFDY